MTERIAVDLDGTLIRSDLLWESALRHVIRTPMGFARVAWWAARGRSTLKTELAARVAIDPSLLPYKTEVVERLCSRRDAGARLVLATAAARQYADDVAHHLGIFEGVLATEPDGPNLRSEAKATAVSAYFDGEDWAYAGDSAKDLKVWRSASRAIAVDVSRSVQSSLVDSGIPVESVTTVTQSPAQLWLKELRPHQWAKNLLVFVPLVTSHQLSHLAALVGALIAFVAFSAIASAVYVVNDLVDLDADRGHLRKRQRPLASGLVPIPQALAVAGLLTCGALALATAVTPWLLVTLVGYVFATNLYSLWLKRKPMIDVTVLSLLYTWRIVAGCVAISVEPTIWLLAFSTFFFFGLALVKRYAELYNVGSGGVARGYGHPDLTLVMMLGVSSNMVAVLVFALYINSDASVSAYQVPQILWGAVPLLLYWVSRTWLVALRGEMQDDPLVYAIRNRVSLTVLALIGAIWALASVVGG